jgi:hypothetical protein
MHTHETRSRGAFLAVGDQLRNRLSCVSDHDLLAVPHASQQVRKDVARVVRVVLRQRYWRGWLSQASLAA